MFKALIVALAAVAAAIPTSHSSSNNENKCDGEVRCCNKEAVGQILPIEALNLMCSGDVVSVIGVLGGNKCDQQTVCCNNVEQNGVVNVACNPIDVL
ncbi:hydrophobin-like protein [Metarhizium guizhouense ARSEF 977]|uniref:Hydrophobin n=1 Tax=Metarhizium guizhouense (strain ARSEF 977) TaxID=1276136 RepID=A0A0B4GFB0_METGA|nr:hydrophobin-like protein [Metarhizium guizhouense ARSEF 977]